MLDMEATKPILIAYDGSDGALSGRAACHPFAKR